MYTREYTVRQGNAILKHWVEVRAEGKDLRRATAREHTGRLSGRQWVKIRKLFRRMDRQARSAAPPPSV